jgi:hypothetical protein
MRLLCNSSNQAPQILMQDAAYARTLSINMEVVTQKQVFAGPSPVSRLASFSRQIPCPSWISS